MRHIGITVILTVFIGLSASIRASAQPSVSITSSFNASPIPAGSYIWFNSQVHTNGLSTTDRTVVTMIDATLQIGGNTYTIPNANITYVPSTTAPVLPSTTYDAATNTWNTTMPAQINGNIFLTGLPIQMPVGLAGGQSPVIFTAVFGSDKPGVAGTFQFSAAAYSSMSNDPNALNVKVSTVGGMDPPGTPENSKSLLIPGGRGDGTSFVGSPSQSGDWRSICCGTPAPTPTPTVTPTPPMTTPTPPALVPEPATIILFGAGLFGLGLAAARRLFGMNN